MLRRHEQKPEVVRHDEISRFVECGNRNLAASMKTIEIVAGAKHLEVSLRLPMASAWVDDFVNGTRSQIRRQRVAKMGMRGKRAKSQVGN